MKTKPTLNVKITSNLNYQCHENQEREKYTARQYLYAEHNIFRKWDHFCLKRFIFYDKKVMSFF